MRPALPPPFRIGIAIALTVGAAACADLTTQSTDAPQAQLPRFEVTTGSEPVSQLLACPTTETQRSQVVIGSAGGIVEARGVVLNIPAGAVPDSTLFEVIVPASQYMETEIHAVGADHYVFQQPVTVSVNFTRCPDVPEAAILRGVYVDPSTYEVLEVMPGVYDRVAHKVTFTTGHLSGYVVAY